MMRGFTLIEIMVALVILGSSLVVLLGLRNRGIAISSEANHVVVATLLAKEKIAQFSIEKDKKSEEQKGEFEDPYKDYVWAITLNETPFPEMKEISLRVIWNEQNRQEHVLITTYIGSEK